MRHSCKDGFKNYLYNRLSVIISILVLVESTRTENIKGLQELESGSYVILYLIYEVFIKEKKYCKTRAELPSKI